MKNREMNTAEVTGSMMIIIFQTRLQDTRVGPISFGDLIILMPYRAMNHYCTAKLEQKTD